MAVDMKEMMENPSFMDALARNMIKEIRGGKVSSLERGKAFGEKHDVSDLSPSTVGYVHGPGGLLSYPGVDQDVFQTVVGALGGILAEIPTMPTEFTDPTFFVVTGFRADEGEEKDAVCDPAPTGGLMKGGILWSPLGRYSRATREIDITRLGKRNNRADPVDLRLVGDSLMSPIFGGDEVLDFQQQNLVSEVAAVMRERAVSFHRQLARQVWIGDPSNNSAQGGYMEFPGLELLVNTGHVDAINNLALPSVDSDIKNFSYGNATGDSADLIAALAAMARYTRNLAERTGVMPVRWVFAMRPELFWEVAHAWPCSYYLGGCTVVDGDGQRVVINATDQIELRDRMIREKFLLIDGFRYEVIEDDGIPEQNGNNGGGNFPNGCFASDIYLLPMSVQGGRSVMFLEYFNYRNPQVSTVLGRDILANVTGPFIDVPSQTRTCVIWEATIEPRLILRTPWLAGKLENVVYCPIQHTRQPFPDDPYFVNGGNTTQAAPSYYAGFKS